MARLSQLLPVLLLLFYDTSSAAEQCTGTPFSIPIANVTLSTGAQRRGVVGQLATPPQAFQFVVSGSRNVTRVDDALDIQNGCMGDEKWKQERCIGHKGGVLDRDKSTSWLAQTLDQWKGPALEEGAGQTLRGEEVLNLGGVTIEHHPIALDTQSAVEPSDHAELGLGPGSGLLDQLVNEGKIPSRTWAYDQGFSGDPSVDPKSWVDGSLTLGGYDKSRISGDIFAQALVPDKDCPLKVTIEAMSIKWSSGEADLMPEGKSEAKLACIVPDYPVISLPGNMFETFNEKLSTQLDPNSRVTGSWYFWSLLNSGKEERFDGNMTIKLSNGFVAEIPNHELVKPYRDLDDNGKPIIREGKDEAALLLNPLFAPNDKDLPLLGMPFLSAAYMIVDHEQNQLRLAKPNRGASALKPDLVPIKPTGCEESSDQLLPTADSKSAPGATPVSGSGSKPKGKGVIIGGVIGGIVGAVALLGAAMALTRRRVKKSVAAATAGRGDPERDSTKDFHTSHFRDSSWSGPLLTEADSVSVNPSRMELDATSVPLTAVRVHEVA